MDFLMRRGLFFLALLAAIASGCGRTPTGEDHFASGLAYYKDGRFDRAAAEFETALGSMHTNALALNFLGVCRLRVGQTEAGLRLLRDAVRLDSSYIPARYNLALALLDQGHPEDAAANLRQVVQSRAAPTDSHYHLGLAYMRISAWGAAEDAFKLDLKTDPDVADTYNCLGVAAARNLEFAQAKHWFEQGLAADPKFATAYLNLASLEDHHLGQKKEALAHYETYLSLIPKSQPREDVKLAMLQIRQDLAAAAKPTAHAVEPPPKPPKSPEPSSAPATEVAPAPKPTPPPPVLSTPAVVVTASVVAATVPPPSPPPPPPPVRKVRTPIAVRTLKPGNRAKATVFFNGGANYQQQGQVANAAAEYVKAVAADPSFAKAYYNLAIAYATLGQPDRALDTYELALVADPHYANARFNYAVLLQEQGYLDDAITQFERILAENPNDAITHFSLGNLYARDRATYAKARDHYQAFLKLSPNSTLSRGVRHWLEQNP
jgi:tetratricopeptide (TPR) repeat protein